MKIKAVRYGRVIPSRDGVRFSTERLELELEPDSGETFEDLYRAAKRIVDEELDEPSPGAGPEGGDR
jgi:hypothetical protein